MKFRTVFATVLLVLAICLSPASAEPMRVLWWDADNDEPATRPANRELMADYLDALDGGSRYDVDYKYGPRRGGFAEFTAGRPPYQLIIVSAANTRRMFNDADLEAFKRHYAGSSGTLMLDGTLGIRNLNYSRRTRWPGVNNSSAHFLQNQIETMRKAGGGLLIGTDHDNYQVPANQLLNALVPGAQFSEETNPSRDGEFFGEALLAQEEAVTPLDILQHWEDVPNQGRAPVGQFADFLGRPVTLFALVEASDKPGGGTRKPYISASIDPGDKRFDIAEEAAPVINRMPTRKSLPAN